MSDFFFILAILVFSLFCAGAIGGFVALFSPGAGVAVGIAVFFLALKTTSDV